MDYVAFRKEVIEAGLLDRQYGWYFLLVASTLTTVFGFGYLLLTSANLWVQLLLVVGLVFAFLQFAGLGHDAGHQAIFSSKRWNDFAGQFFLSLFCGVGYNYWVDRHNSHHANPNHEGKDPDLEVFTLTEKAIMEKKGISRFLAERQHLLFVPITSTFIFGMQPRSVMFNFAMKSTFGKWTDLALLLCHFGAVWVLPFFFLPVWKAAFFIVMLRLLMGVYFGTIVASNHKGMGVVKSGEQLDFVEKQVLTARNVRNNFLVDYLYVGLNYQIEHHLFPTMPRNNFRKCKPLVKTFCAENGLNYEELGVVASYRAILGELKRVALFGSQSREVRMVNILPSKAAE
jgi:fatty acid desaturase